MSTKKVVAIGIGAALYGVISMFSIPIGPNTSLILAVALLVIFGAMYGPSVGFFTGLIGHILRDLIQYGSVWFSWTLLSAMIGLFAGLIVLDKTFSVMEGKVTIVHLVKLAGLCVLGLIVGGFLAVAGDVYVYGEPFAKSLLQIEFASVGNALVIAVLGIPSVMLIAKTQSKAEGIDSEEA
ncbi:MAG: ECF-type riboflavin transporter substrate-binding protein [Mycoplasmatales bacterium]